MKIYKKLPQVEKSILTLLAKGMMQKDIEEMLDLPSGKIQRWRNWDKAFRYKCLEAEKQPHIKALEVVINGLPDDPKLAKWFLERRYPETWGEPKKFDAETVELEKERLKADTENLKSAIKAREERLIESKLERVTDAQDTTINVNIPNFDDLSALDKAKNGNN